MNYNLIHCPPKLGEFHLPNWPVLNRSRRLGLNHGGRRANGGDARADVVVIANQSLGVRRTDDMFTRTHSVFKKQHCQILLSFWIFDNFSNLIKYIVIEMECQNKIGNTYKILNGMDDKIEKYKGLSLANRCRFRR